MLSHLPRLPQHELRIGAGHTAALPVRGTGQAVSSATPAVSSMNLAGNDPNGRFRGFAAARPSDQPRRSRCCMSEDRDFVPVALGSKQTDALQHARPISWRSECPLPEQAPSKLATAANVGSPPIRSTTLAVRCSHALAFRKTALGLFIRPPENEAVLPLVAAMQSGARDRRSLLSRHRKFCAKAMRAGLLRREAKPCGASENSSVS